MNQKRINLCFDLDNPRHKAVYDLLQKVGRDKTSTVIQALYDAALMKKKDTEGKRELEKKLTSDFIEALEKNSNKDELKEIRDSLDNISRKLETLSVHPESAISTEPQIEPKETPTKYIEDEMNDDAFQSVIGMLDGFN